MTADDELEPEAVRQLRKHNFIHLKLAK